MRTLRTVFAWALLGFLTNTLVVIFLSWISFSSYENERFIDGRDVRHLTSDFSASVPARSIDSLGYRRRGWYYNPGFSVSMSPGLPFNYFLHPNRGRLDFPFRNGPFFAWAIGGDRAWGRLYNEPLTSLEEVRRFSGFECAAGFPALSAWHGLNVKRDDTATTPGGIRLPDPTGMVNAAYEVRAIPYRPIWPGLIFNTIFYALLAFVTHRLLRTIREHRRFTKGRCPTCRYDLNANFAPGCPECGWRREATQPAPP